MEKIPNHFLKKSFSNRGEGGGDASYFSYMCISIKVYKLFRAKLLALSKKFGVAVRLKSIFIHGYKKFNNGNLKSQ